MKAIFASKLYRDSKRKESINAALSDPVNQGLVKQLRSYLDDSTLSQLENNSEDVVLDDVKVEEDQDDDKIIPSKYTESRVDAPRGHGHISHDDSFEIGGEDSELDEGSSNQNQETEDKSNLEESHNISGRDKITGNTSLEYDISKELDAIRGLIDSREETCGTARLTVKNDELWIHFQDSVNLNNIMEPVIALLSSAGYYGLQFNRLARTENAIVFMISGTSIVNDEAGEE